MKRILHLSTAIGIALATSQVAAHATQFDVSALNSTGVTTALAAGSYTVAFNSNTFQAWNPWSDVTGCDSDGANCNKGWLVSLQLDLGNGADNFDGTNGYSYYYSRPDTYPKIFSTAAQALASAQTGADLKVAPLSQANNAAAFVPGSYPISFTLPTAQNVKFSIYDSPYGDNTGGVSFTLSPAAVPEPATWAMMIAGVGILGGAMRRRAVTRVSYPV